MSDFWSTVSKNRLAQVILGIFVILTTWWLWLQLIDTDPTTNNKQLWAAVYQIVAIYGAIAGFYISSKWGGINSVLGRAITAFSLGLLFQSFGQTSYSYYIFYEKIDVPYPSIGDIGFFGSIPFYIYGAFQVAKMSGAKVSLKSYRNQIWAILLPLVMLFLSYNAFLKDYDFEGATKLLVFLDFGYPLGQAIYVSIAVLAFFLSRKLLGGRLKKPTLFLLTALVVQYISDSSFLYQALNSSYSVGGLIDYIYLISYLLMAISLIQLGHLFKQIKSE